MIKFVKENKRSKEWRTMKISIDFENGMSLTLKPENIQLIDNGGKQTVVITRTENAIIPLLFFPGLLATAEELNAREAKAKAVVDAAYAAADAAATKAPEPAPAVTAAA